jgi:cysteine desulfurase
VQGKTRIYLDYASATPIDPVLYKQIPAIPKHIAGANPSALHAEGVLLKRYLTDARTRASSAIHAHPDELMFTSNATESDNIAIRGLVQAWCARGIVPGNIVVMTSAIEHAAVTETAAMCSALGVGHATIPAEGGIVDPKMIIVPEGARAVLVSVMMVNNEIGTVQPVKEVAKRIRFLRKQHPEVQFVFHTDATQAPLHYDLNVQKLGVDMMTLGATKLYCAKGVGVLYIRRGVTINPVMRGGGQERGLRPGTEPVQLIHEFSYALEYAQKEREVYTAKILGLQQYFESLLLSTLPGLVITAQDIERTPHITHVGIKDFDSELMVIELDARGIAVSAKSACKNEEDEESPIVESLYGKGWGAVRFSFGRMTTKKELQKTVGALRSVLKKYNLYKYTQLEKA